MINQQFKNAVYRGLLDSFDVQLSCKANLNVTTVGLTFKMGLDRLSSRERLRAALQILKEK